MAEFPEMKGFSERNLKYIRQWYSFFMLQVPIGQQVVSQSDQQTVGLIGAKNNEKKSVIDQQVMDTSGPDTFN